MIAAAAMLFWPFIFIWLAQAIGIEIFAWGIVFLLLTVICLSIIHDNNLLTDKGKK